MATEVRVPVETGTDARSINNWLQGKIASGEGRLKEESEMENPDAAIEYEVDGEPVRLELEEGYITSFVVGEKTAESLESDGIIIRVSEPAIRDI